MKNISTVELKFKPNLKCSKTFHLLSLVATSSFLAGCSLDPERYVENSLQANHEEVVVQKKTKPLYTASLTAPEREKNYSLKNYNYNSKRVQVRSNDTLYSLAKRHRVPLASLIRANHLKDHKIKVGQQLIIPENYAAGSDRLYVQELIMTSSLKKRTKNRTLTKSRHQLLHRRVVVRPNDTLYGFSKLYDVSLGSLMAANNLKGQKIKVGQLLIIPEKLAFNTHRNDPLETGSIRRNAKGTVYARHIMNKKSRVIVVRSRDTLNGLSRRYRIPARSIMAANSLTTSKLKRGQYLIIPDSCAPFCKS